MAESVKDIKKSMKHWKDKKKAGKVTINEFNEMMKLLKEDLEFVRLN